MKVVETSGVSIEEFKLAGARQQFRFNETTGATEAVPALAGLPLQAVAAEIPRYIQLWNQQFAPYSVIGFKVRCKQFNRNCVLMQEQNGVPANLTVSGTEWFKENNFTALPILLVNPLALYGYGDIRLVPAVS